jgi:hypothetical protein
VFSADRFGKLDHHRTGLVRVFYTEGFEHLVAGLYGLGVLDYVRTMLDGPGEVVFLRPEEIGLHTPCTYTLKEEPGGDLLGLLMPRVIEGRRVLVCMTITEFESGALDGGG